jgi:potassium/hydrogen antiporter
VAELSEFGLVVTVVACAATVAVLAYRLSEWSRVPAAGLLLIAAAVASDLVPELGRELSTRDVERVAVVALVVILFDGGMRVGRRRFRESVVPVVSLGVIGTLATAVVVAVAAHALLDLEWSTAAVVGAALAPTDPAVMFSVFGRREVTGRTATILEGEAGTNDPVGIALTVAALDVATSGSASVGGAAVELLVELAIGLAIGVAGGLLLVYTTRRLRLPDRSLYPLWTLSVAAVVYGVSSVAHGSGFLAVYVAGILAGDAPLPARPTILGFQTSLAGLAEIVVFVALGLTIDVTSLGEDWLWLDGVALAAVLLLVARPLAVGPLLLPVRLTGGERAFVVWSGLKGAVPILLASFALLEDVQEASRVYGIVVVVVACSVLLQGSTIPFAAERLGVPMVRSRAGAS